MYFSIFFFPPLVGRIDKAEQSYLWWCCAHHFLLPTLSSPSIISSHLPLLILSSFGQGIRQKYWKAKTRFTFPASKWWYICEPSFHLYPTNELQTFVSLDYASVYSPFDLIYQNFLHIIRPLLGSSGLMLLSQRWKIMERRRREEAWGW